MATWLMAVLAAGAAGGLTVEALYRRARALVRIDEAEAEFWVAACEGLEEELGPRFTTTGNAIGYQMAIGPDGSVHSAYLDADTGEWIQEAPRHISEDPELQSVFSPELWDMALDPRNHNE